LTPLAIRLLAQHESTCDAVLSRAYRKIEARGQEVVFNHTPLDEVIGREGCRGVDPASKLKAELEAKEAEEWKIKRSAQDMLLEYFFADGPGPDKVIRRIYAVVKAIRSDLILDMSYQELALLVGETKAAQAWRFDKVIGGTLEAAGFLGTQFPHQKSSSSKPNYAAAQEGNKNRRGGKKTEKHTQPNHEE
jgi:hypothetical protein